MRCPLALLVALVAFSASAQDPPPDPGGTDPAEAPAVVGAAGVAEGSAATPPPTGEAGREGRDAPGSSRRAAVLVVAATQAEEEAADALTEVLIGAIASRGGVEIVGKEELQALLHQGEARSLECVSSPPCLGRLGVQLRVAEAVVGTLAHDADRWTFDLTRLDVRAGTALGRVFREVAGDLASVAAAMLDSVQELYESQPQPARLRFAANVPARVFLGEQEVGVYRQEPIRVEGIDPGSWVVRAEPLRQGYLPWTRALELEAGADVRVEASLERSALSALAVPTRGPWISPLVWVGSGVVAAAGVVALAFGLRSRRDVPEGVNRSLAVAFVEDRRRDALVANIGLGFLAAGVSVGVVGLVLSDFGGDGRLRATVARRPGGVQLVLEGWL